MLYVFIRHELNLCLMPMQGILYLLAFMYMPFSTYPRRVSFRLKFHFHFICSYLTGPSPKNCIFGGQWVPISLHVSVPLSFCPSLLSVCHVIALKSNLSWNLGMLYELYFKNECVIIHVPVNNFFTFIFSSTPAGKRFLQLQQQVEVLQEENFKLETGKTRIILMVCEFDVKLNHTNNYRWQDFLKFYLFGFI